MNRRSTVSSSRVAVSAAFAGLLLLVFGCGSQNALVGAECVSGATSCDGVCVDPTKDSDNCGACGNVCSAGASCVEGVCSELTDAGTGSDAAQDAAPDSGCLPPAETLELGRMEGLRAGVAIVLAARGVSVSDEGRARLASCTNSQTLTVWMARASSASSEAAILKSEDPQY